MDVGMQLVFASHGWDGIRDSQVIDEELRLSRLADELGYTDVLGVREALARTARWYVENPPPKGGDIERALGDPFEYTAEDRLIEAYRAGLAAMAAVYPDAQDIAWHPYAHPREAGVQRDQKGR